MEFEQVRDIIVETLGCDAEQVTMDASLADDLGADSLASVELVMALEEATGISIEDSALAEMNTIITCLRLSPPSGKTERMVGERYDQPRVF